MAAHLYWRLNITANAGDTAYLAVAELEFRATIGGADQCTGGTAISGAFDIPANAFDNNATTRASNTVSVFTGWIGYQFASAVDVLQYTIQAHPTTPLRSPSVWALQYSDDGTSWTSAESRSGYVAWTNGEIKSFTVGSVAVTSAKVAQEKTQVVSTGVADVNVKVAQARTQVVSTGIATVNAQVAQARTQVVSTGIAVVNAQLAQQRIQVVSSTTLYVAPSYIAPIINICM